MLVSEVSLKDLFMNNSKRPFYRTREFLKIQKRWYSKLKNNGFEDIENGKDRRIVRREIIKMDESSPNAWSGQNYTELCAAILRDYRFKRPIDRIIFEKHSEGKSVREIETYLSENVKGRTLKYRAICYVIQNIKEDYLKGSY